MKMLISKKSVTMTTASWRRSAAFPPFLLIPLLKISFLLMLLLVEPTTQSAVATPPRFISLKHLARKPTLNETSTMLPSSSLSSSSSSSSSSASHIRSSSRFQASPSSSSAQSSFPSSKSSSSSLLSSSSKSLSNGLPSSFPSHPSSSSLSKPKSFKASSSSSSSSSSFPSSSSSSSSSSSGQASSSPSSSKSKPKPGGHKSKPDALARLSKVFGISRIPHRVFHRSPPQYMKDLYDSITDTGGLSRTAGPYDSNIIRSLPDRDPLHRMHFHYNLSDLDRDENVVEAQFHLFKMRPRPMGEGKPSHLIVIKVYQVLYISDMTLQKNLFLLDVKRIPAHTHGWLVFNVTKAVNAWYKGKANNFGFLVTAETHSGRAINGTYVRFAQRNEHHDSKQPILVMFGNDGRPQHSNYIKPSDKEYLQIKEDILKRERRKEFRKNNDFRQVVRMLNERDRKRRPSGRSKRSANSRSGNRRKRTYDMYRYRHKRRTCARYEMFVDFEEIGWSGWIISPNSYNAYHCSGECPFPLGQNQKPTNHATVQSIVHALRVGKDVGTPCCVPNKLYSISLLYFDDNENVILKQYDDMVVASCGCH